MTAPEDAIDVVNDYGPNYSSGAVLCWPLAMRAELQGVADRQDAVRGAR